MLLTRTRANDDQKYPGIGSLESTTTPCHWKQSVSWGERRLVEQQPHTQPRFAYLTDDGLGE